MTGIRFLWVALVAAMVGWSGCAEPQPSTRPPQNEPLKVLNLEPLPEFSFINQDSTPITEATVAGKVHVVDFFFTNCPTICPRMKANMLTVYEEFVSDDRVVLLSHAIDTRRDTVPVLKEYSERLEVSAPRWHFVTGEKDAILGIARDYKLAANEDSTAPGGFAHSGALILLDQKRDIRGYYSGVSEEETAEMIGDMKKLLAEDGE
ncbi:MAG: SCO family protein [Bacteroidota bacterium]